MKITVVGGGSAGCVTALHYAYYTRHLHNIEVELIHDPTILPVEVGQGTLLDIPTLLHHALGSDWCQNEIKAIPKLGILYENWGKKNHKFFHPFALHNVGLHMKPEDFQRAILSSGLIENVVEANVSDLSEVDSNVIFDCRGRNKDNIKEYDELISPINTCLLAIENVRDQCQLWTRAVATPDGWTFVIPNVDETTSYGYLYNNDITSDKEAIKNFETIFKGEFKHGMITKKVKFDSYVAKDLARIENDRIVILNGNRCCFIEPLEATSLTSYLNICRFAWDWVIDEIEFGKKHVNLLSRKMIEEVSIFILYHYIKGSKYDTKFWKYAVEMAEFGVDDSRTHFHNVINSVKYNESIDLRDETKWPSVESYGTWPYISYKNWYENVIC